MLELNFFQIDVPSELPFLVRPLPSGETLRASERGWQRFENNKRLPNKEAMLVDSDVTPIGYASQPVRIDSSVVPMVKPVLEEGFKQFLGGSGYRVEGNQLGFFAYLPDDIVRHGVPGFVTLHRGVVFRIDHISTANSISFGFFIGCKSRLRFAVGLEDPDLSSAAINAHVLVQTGTQKMSGKLLQVDATNRTAQVAFGNETKEVLYSEVTVPAKSDIVTRYCRNAGISSEARKAFVSAQVATFRLKAEGVKNRTWLYDQYAWICTWLDRLDQYKRIAFNWPRTEVALVLKTRPVTLQQFKST